MQQAIDVAIQTERKVAIGRSTQNVNIARSLGYMDGDDVIVKPQELDDVLPDKQLIVCRLAGRADVGPDADRVQRPPGREGRERRHRHHLGEAGAGNELRVHGDQPGSRGTARRSCTGRSPVHVSGHACEEEIRTVIRLDAPEQ